MYGNCFRKILISIIIRGMLYGFLLLQRLPYAIYEDVSLYTFLIIICLWIYQCIIIKHHIKKLLGYAIKPFAIIMPYLNETFSKVKPLSFRHRTTVGKIVHYFTIIYHFGFNYEDIKVTFLFIFIHGIHAFIMLTVLDLVHYASIALENTGLQAYSSPSKSRRSGY